jgi:hypothetical protein
MSDHTLNDIMCLALVDGKFRHSLLTDVANAVGEFDLDPEEHDILKGIKAESVTEFARKLHTYMLQRDRGNGHRKTYGPGQLRNMWNQGCYSSSPLPLD